MPSSSESKGKYEKEEESDASPPSYSVMENRNGSLVNLELQVKWPNRPKKGRYSEKEYLKRKRQYQKEKKRYEKSQKELKLKKSPESVTEFEKFVGTHSANRVTEFLRPTEFVLYYQKPNIKSLDEMPICLPLSIAYMTSKSKIYHFGIDFSEDESGTLWSVALGNGSEQPYFRTLKGLISYYTKFGNLRKDGNVEIFNVRNK